MADPRAYGDTVDAAALPSRKLDDRSATNGKEARAPTRGDVLADARVTPAENAASISICSTNIGEDALSEKSAEGSAGDFVVGSSSESGDDRQAQSSPVAAMTLSGASGQHLAKELAAALRKPGPRCRPVFMWSGKELAAALRKKLPPLRSHCSPDLPDVVLKPLNAWERVEQRVKNCYDQAFGVLFNVVYDVLQFSSGRDKFCGLLQNYAKFASVALSRPDSERHWMYRGIEDSLSEGRKIFRLFKELREVYKIRRGFNRLQLGVEEDGVVCVSAVCGMLDVLGHTGSFFYYLFDNLLWAASVGLVRAKAVPRLQSAMWQGGRRNGAVISYFGGVERIHRMKNVASIWRLTFAFAANVLLLRRARQWKEGQALEGPDDPRLFHSLELLGMAASFRDLLDKLEYLPISSDAYAGLLGMLGSLVGLWGNWRKVNKDQCGTKRFSTVAERRHVATACSVVKTRDETPSPALAA